MQHAGLAGVGHRVNLNLGGLEQIADDLGPVLDHVGRGQHLAQQRLDVGLADLLVDARGDALGLREHAIGDGEQSAHALGHGKRGPGRLRGAGAREGSFDGGSGLGGIARHGAREDSAGMSRPERRGAL